MLLVGKRLLVTPTLTQTTGRAATNTLSALLPTRAPGPTCAGALTSVEEGIDVLVFPQGGVVEIVSQSADGILQRERNSTCSENNHQSTTVDSE